MMSAQALIRDIQPARHNTEMVFYTPAAWRIRSLDQLMAAARRGIPPVYAGPAVCRFSAAPGGRDA